MRTKTLVLNPYMHMVLLALLVAFTFNRTLGSYFLADDFGEIAYVSRIAGGDLGMLWANFSGNYMQISSMSVWRPWLLISLLTDFIIWGAKPFGYYLTNLLSYTGVVLALYLLVRNLTRDWCRTRASLAAFFSAAIFALNPLHCESVSWVVGRVDIICAFFYLVCLNLFILSLKSDRKHYKKLTILSVVSFWLAMWTKEMAIGAPFLALTIALLWGEPALDFKKSIRLSAPLLISTVVYFVLRYFALGTILGGYTQGIGDAQAAGALSHWLDGDTLRRLFFPLAYSIYGGSHIFQTILALVYTLLGALVLLRLASLSAPLRWLLFLPIWLITALAPIYKLWGLGYELEGARFVFFATMPLATFLPVLLFAPHTRSTAAKGPGEKRLRPAFAALSLVGLLGLCFVLGKIASNLNLEWVHAGKEVREFAEKSRALAEQNPDNNTIILGIPKRRGGAHMVLNGTTFKILLNPPFTAKPLGQRFLTFDPIIFGNADYINAQRFQNSVDIPGTGVVIWDSQDRAFKDLKLAPGTNQLPQLLLPTAPGSMGFLHTTAHALIENIKGRDNIISAISHITAGDGIYFGNLNFSPLDADFAEVTLTCLEAPPGRPVALNCSWQDDQGQTVQCASPAPFSALPGEQKVYVRLSQSYHWYAQEAVHSLFLELPPQTRIAVGQVRLIRDAEICPQLSLSPAPGVPAKNPISPIGVYPIGAGEDIKVNACLSPFLQSGTVILEISRANTFFENFSNIEQDKVVETTLKQKAAGTVHFSVPPLPAGANYQIRARLVDGHDRPLGEPSDPLVVRVD